MFSEATSFDQPLDKWNISDVCYIEGMFNGASSYSHYPSKWTLPHRGWPDIAGKPFLNQYYIFEETKIEEKEKSNPLKLKKRKNQCHYY